MKASIDTTYDSVGDVLDYTFAVSNDGNVRLAAPVTIDDDRTSDETCPDLSGVGNGDAFLDPGETVTCSASYTVTQADLDAGSVTNSATASAEGTDSNEDSLTIDAAQDAALTLVKAITSGDPYSAIGDVISYRYLVTNSGNVTLLGPITVDDDKTAVTCPTVDQLAPSDSIDCTASYSVTRADLQAASVTNIAFATAAGAACELDPDEGARQVAAIDCDEPIVSNSDTATATVEYADLSLSKSVSDTTPAVGDTVTFTITLSDAGPATATGVKVQERMTAGYTYRSHSASIGTYDLEGGIWDVGTVANGRSATLLIRARVNATGPYRNYVQVIAVDQPDPDSAAGNGSIDEDDDDALVVSPTALQPSTDMLRSSEALSSAGSTPSGVIVGMSLLVSLMVVLSGWFIGTKRRRRSER